VGAQLQNPYFDSHIKNSSQTTVTYNCKQRLRPTIRKTLL